MQIRHDFRLIAFVRFCSVELSCYLLLPLRLLQMLPLLLLLSLGWGQWNESKDSCNESRQSIQRAPVIITSKRLEILAVFKSCFMKSTVAEGF